MNSISAILQGIIRLKSAAILWTILYLALLLFALFFAVPINQLLESTLGHSLEMQGKAGVFDYTMIADLINNQKQTVLLLIAQAKWIIILFLLVSIFLRAGTVAYFFFQKEKFSISDYIKDCTQYFWRFLRANIYFLFLQGLIFFVFFFLFQFFSGGLSPFEIENNSNLVNAFYIVVPLYLICVILLIILADLTKFEIIRIDENYIHRAIISAFRLIFKKLFSILLFYGLLFLLFFGFYKLFQLLQHMISPDSGIGIWVLLFLGQLYIFIRVGLGLVRYGGLRVLTKF